MKHVYVVTKFEPSENSTLSFKFALKFRLAYKWLSHCDASSVKLPAAASAQITLRSQAQDLNTSCRGEQSLTSLRKIADIFCIYYKCQVLMSVKIPLLVNKKNIK